MRASTILTLTGATLVTGFVGYAAYFDYKRRNDPDFRKKLKKDAKKTSREIKKRTEQRQKLASETIQRTVNELNRPGALPSNASEREEIFMQSVQEGEMLLTQGPELYVAAAAAFYRGMKVYPSPKDLLLIYQKAVPEEALNYIFEMLSKDPSMTATGGGPNDPLMNTTPSGAQLEEIDDDSPSNDAAATPTTATFNESASPPSASLSTNGSGNGDASSQEWEKVSQHEEEEKKAETDSVVTASDEELTRVAQEAMQKSETSGVETAAAAE